MKKINIKRVVMGVLAVVLVFANVLVSGLSNVENVSAFGVSPPNKSVVLNPGDTYRDTVTVVNTDVGGSEDFYYKIVVKPFDMNGNDNVYDSSSDRNMIVDWIKILGDETGVVPYGETKEVEYVVNVPEDAPVGGQYAAITVTADDEASGDNGDSVGIKENMAIAYLLYAEIAGETVRQGEIESASVPSFILSGDIKGTSAVKNTGNVHGKAYYTLKVFPLFSGEELYTNEEDPAYMTILPDRTYYNELAWRETPAMGVFNVVYKVDFEGVTTEVSKLVIKCPVWLLFIILFIVAALIIWIVMRIRSKKKGSRRTAED